MDIAASSRRHRAVCCAIPTTTTVDGRPQPLLEHARYHVREPGEPLAHVTTRFGGLFFFFFTSTRLLGEDERRTFSLARLSCFAGAGKTFFFLAVLVVVFRERDDLSMGAVGLGVPNDFFLLELNFHFLFKNNMSQ